MVKTILTSYLLAMISFIIGYFTAGGKRFNAWLVVNSLIWPYWTVRGILAYRKW